MKDRQEILKRLRSTEDLIQEVIQTNENKTTADIRIDDQLKNLTESNDALSRQLNEIQDELFEGDAMIRKPPRRNRTQTAQEDTVQEADTIQEADKNADKDTREPRLHETDTTKNTWESSKPARVFRDMKGKGLIFGDSNTKGLQSDKIKMKIGSLSGASLDSAIHHLKSSINQPDHISQVVIYHLGTNNLSTDNDETIKAKISQISSLAQQKYPKATIGFCQIPQCKGTLNKRVQDLNDYISTKENVHLIRNEITSNGFTGDEIHYNTKGLAHLATSIKVWAKSNGHVTVRKTRNDFNQQSIDVYRPTRGNLGYQSNMWFNQNSNDQFRRDEPRANFHRFNNPWEYEHRYNHRF